MEEHALSESENKPPAEVVRTKRLEIVDNEGKVRAALGTDEDGVASLSMFGASGKLGVSLDASNVPEQSNGLALFDTSGELQVAVGASTGPSIPLGSLGFRVSSACASACESKLAQSNWSRASAGFLG
jgi:hypothetical protein